MLKCTTTKIIFYILAITTGFIVKSPDGEAFEKKFNLNQVIEYAFQNNGELNALKEEKGISESESMRAGLYPNPSLDIEGVTGKMTGSDTENSISFEISQELLTAGKRKKRLEVANKELERILWQIENFKRLLKEEINILFSSYLLAEKKVELSKRFSGLTSKLIEISQERLKAGDISELELNLARVESARSKGIELEAQAELVETKLKLLSIMGAPLNEEIDFTGSFEIIPYHSVETLKKLAMEKRPDLRSLEVESEKAEAEINLSKSGRIPNVTLSAGFERENSAVEVEEKEWKESNNLLSFRLSIPITLFDRNQASIKEALAKKGSAETLYLFEKQKTKREVENNYSRLEASEKAVSLYSDLIVPQLEENITLMQEAYSLGEVGILMSIEEQKKFFEVYEGFLKALFNRQVAFAALEAAAGIEIAADSTGDNK